MLDTDRQTVKPPVRTARRVQLNVRVSPALATAFRQRAEANRRTVGEELRMAMEEHLAVRTEI